MAGEPNPVAQIIAVRTVQWGIADTAFMAALHFVLPPETFWHVGVPVNALWCAAGLSGYFVSVFVPGVLPQPVKWLRVPPRFYRLPETDGDAVALTFDDGPHPDTTPHLLELLAKHDAKATFFLVGKQVQTYPHLAAQISDEGHTIGVHGLHHRTMILQNARQIRRDLSEAQQIIERATGTPLTRRFLRPPYGFKSWALCRVAARAGWQIVDWSLDVRDYETGDGGTPAQIAARFTRGLDTNAARNAAKKSGGEIVLLHEQVPHENGMARAQTTLEALPRILRVCQKRGLRCIALQ